MPLERLQKIIAAAGICSRRDAEELITAGRVRVNGPAVTELGAKADSEKDEILVDGKPLRRGTQHVYLMLNKPRGCVTTVDDPEGRPTVMEFLKHIKERIYPVGRLDFHSEGLLLFTNDGEFANRILSTGFGVNKTYWAKVHGTPSAESLQKLREGIMMDGRLTLPAEIRPLPAQGGEDWREAGAKGRKTKTAAKPRKPRRDEPIRASRDDDDSDDGNPWFEVVLQEGRQNQIRRMFELMGHPVRKLRRVRIGRLSLGPLKPGEFRHLLPGEVSQLMAGEREKASSLPRPRRSAADFRRKFSRIEQNPSAEEAIDQSTAEPSEDEIRVPETAENVVAPTLRRPFERRPERPPQPHPPQPRYDERMPSRANARHSRRPDSFRDRGANRPERPWSKPSQPKFPRSPSDRPSFERRPFSGDRPERRAFGAQGTKPERFGRDREKRPFTGERPERRPFGAEGMRPEKFGRGGERRPFTPGRPPGPRSGPANAERPPRRDFPRPGSSQFGFSGGEERASRPPRSGPPRSGPPRGGAPRHDDRRPIDRGRPPRPHGGPPRGPNRGAGIREDRPREGRPFERRPFEPRPPFQDRPRSPRPGGSRPFGGRPEGGAPLSRGPRTGPRNAQGFSRPPRPGGGEGRRPKSPSKRFPEDRS